MNFHVILITHFIEKNKFDQNGFYDEPCLMLDDQYVLVTCQLYSLSTSLYETQTILYRETTRGVKQFEQGSGGEIGRQRSRVDLVEMIRIVGYCSAPIKGAICY